MLIWTIHDFLGYGIVVGVAHQGFVACLICGPRFKGEFNGVEEIDLHWNM
jgi:hypothetical protein